MDPHTFFLEQDRRMNLPDEDVDLYLDRMATYRKSQGPYTRVENVEIAQSEDRISENLRISQEVKKNVAVEQGPRNVTSSDGDNPSQQSWHQRSPSAGLENFAEIENLAVHGSQMMQCVNDMHVSVNSDLSLSSPKLVSRRITKRKTEPDQEQRWSRKKSSFEMNTTSKNTMLTPLNYISSREAVHTYDYPDSDQNLDIGKQISVSNPELFADGAVASPRVPEEHEFVDDEPIFSPSVASFSEYVDPSESLKRKASEKHMEFLMSKKQRIASMERSHELSQQFSPISSFPRTSDASEERFQKGPVTITKEGKLELLPLGKTRHERPHSKGKASAAKTSARVEPLVADSCPPTSPIEEPSIISPSRNILSTKPSKIVLEVKERIAKHASMKSHNKVIKLAMKPPAVVDGPSHSNKLETVQDVVDVTYISSASSSRSSSPILEPLASVKKGKARAGIAAVKEVKAKSKAVKLKPKEKMKEKLTPIEYARTLQPKIVTIQEKIGTNNLYKCLQGKVIFYTGGDMQWASERTRGRMDIIVKNGGILLPTFDPSRVTHIVTDANKAPTLRALGLKRFRDIPEHIPTVKWEWVLSGIGRALGKEETEAKMRETWLYAAYSERIDAGLAQRTPSVLVKEKIKEAVNINRVSDFSQDNRLLHREATIAPDSEDEDDSEVAVVATLDPGQLPLSPPTSPEHGLVQAPSNGGDSNRNLAPDDPLSKFYARAKAEYGGTFSRPGEVEDTDKETDDEDNFEPVGPIPRRGWTCDKKVGPEPTTCPNQDVIDKFQELMELHKSKLGDDDHWRAFTYTIPALRKYPRRIQSLSEARSIRGVGARTAEKIMEIILTGNLRRIEYEKTDDVKVTRLFQGIYGVGQSTAFKWYSAGCRSLEDVRTGKNGVTLSPAQEIGLRFYDDINDRMPRDEAKALFDLIKPIALSIDPKLYVEVMGSYRRGKATCGDIDILITRDPSDGRTHGGVLTRLLQDLHDTGIITEDLALPDEPLDLEAIYRGLCRLPKEGSRRRRIDFLTVPWSSKGAALLYYTGDDIFNRAIRWKANALGYSLNQRGLFDGVVRDPRDRRLKLHPGTVVASKTEEEIFKILGVPWQEPHERVRG